MKVHGEYLCEIEGGYEAIINGRYCKILKEASRVFRFFRPIATWRVRSDALILGEGLTLKRAVADAQRVTGILVKTDERWAEEVA